MIARERRGRGPEGGAIVRGACVALALAACGEEERPAPPPAPVSVARAERAAVPFELEATGTVEPMQTVALRSQVSGVLTRVGFEEGADVEAGQVLFQIDPRPFQAALEQARAMLDRDLAQLENARQEVRRYEQLAAQEYVTAQQYDEVRTNAAALQATVAAGRAAVESARLDLQNATIRSPIDGRAGDLLVRPGNLVQANGDPLVVVNQIEPILVRFTIPASRLPLVRRHGGGNLAVRARTAGGEGEVGRLTFVDNAVDTATGTVLLKARFENAGGALWPGAFVNVVLELGEQADALVVPARAVVRGQEGDHVFVVEGNGTARLVPVTVGRTVGDRAVVESGLQGGEQVVTEGQLRLTSGSRVQVQAAPTAREGTS